MPALVPLVEFTENMSGYRIPFNKPCLTGNELVYVAECIRQGHIAADGGFTKRCRQLLEKELGVEAVFLVTSCTHALEMAAILLDIRPGDEVIIPAFTFVSTANAFVLRGAQPVFVDIRPDTLNLDETRLAQLISPRTKAIVPVHYAGVGCEMAQIMAVAREHQVPVVEDNAHGLFGRYRGQYLGTFGCMATQSFHETKNFTCGEGGALLINDARFVQRAEYIREKGTNRNRFFRGQVDKYTWVDIGSSYALADQLAAFLFAQIEKRDHVQSSRRRMWNRYNEDLQDWANASGVRLPIIPVDCEQPYHMFYMLLPSLEVRQGLIAHLREHGVLSVFHYLPLHLSEMGVKFGGRPGQCPVTEDVSDRLLRLPSYNDLTIEDQAEIVEAIKAFPMPKARPSIRAVPAGSG
jgi:dTDP-4-amino-4,6-dideoxygalactose transaminase